MPQVTESQAAFQFLLTGVESLFGTLIHQEEPILVDAALARLKTRIEGRAAAIVKNDVAHGWSPTHLGDPKNDYRRADGSESTIQEKRCDNTLFVFAHQAGGTLADLGFRDRFSGFLTPLIYQQVNDASTPEEIAQATTGTIYGVVELAVRNATGVTA